jgi:hypothetical protein
MPQKQPPASTTLCGPAPDGGAGSSVGGGTTTAGSAAPAPIVATTANAQAIAKQPKTARSENAAQAFRQRLQAIAVLRCCRAARRGRTVYLIQPATGTPITIGSRQSQPAVTRACVVAAESPAGIG